MSAGDPIPFNPNGMTVQELKDCAELLYRTFGAIDREVDDHNIVYHLKVAREQFRRTWRRS